MRDRSRYNLGMPEPQPKPARGPDMRVTVAGVEFASPVIAASGTFGYGVEFEELVSFPKIGGFVTKGLSREPMAGNPMPRIIETSAGMMNAIGLQNMGVRAFIDAKMPRLRELPGAVVIANVFGFTIQDCCEVIERLNDAPGIALYELNASCPNTAHGGMVFGTDPRLLDELVQRVERISQRPLMVKLSPNVTSIAAMAKAAQDAGAQAVSLVNTFLSLAIDPETRRPRIANVTAGLSGRQSSRSRCAWCMRRRRRLLFRSSAWGGFCGRRMRGIHARRRNRGAGGYGELCGSACGGKYRNRTAQVVCEP